MSTDAPVSPSAEPLPRRHVEFRAALGITGLWAVVGLAMGVAWWLLSPRPEYLVGRDGAVALVPASENAFIAADGVFAVLGLVLGAVVGGVAVSRWTQAGPGVVLGAGVGGVVGAGVAWGLGTVLGRVDVPAAAAAAGEGATVRGPLQLHALGVVLTGAVAAVVAVLAVVISRTGPWADDEHAADDATGNGWATEHETDDGRAAQDATVDAAAVGDVPDGQVPDEAPTSAPDRPSVPDPTDGGDSAAGGPPSGR